MDCPLCGRQGRPLEKLAPLESCDACQFAFNETAIASDTHDEAYFDMHYGPEKAKQLARDAQVRTRFIGAARGDLLEVGSAAGHFLAETARAGWRSVGIEQSAYMVEHRVSPDLSVRLGLIEEVPLEPGSFDAVCAWHVVEHLNDPTGVLGRLRDALRPGGRVFVEVPNFAGVRARELGMTWPGLQPKHHAGHHSPQSLGILLTRAGFRDVETISMSPIAYLSPRWRLNPQTLAHQAKHAMVTRTTRLEHPVAHDLLRATAIR